MKKVFLLIFICCGGVSAGVNDYFVYDLKDRFQLESLDGVVLVKVVDYYVFADPGLVTTLVEERKKINGDVMRIGSLADLGISTSKGSEQLYIDNPVLNAILQLKRNSLWIIDAEILEVLDGSIEKKRAFIAMKRTRAFKYHESPAAILSSSSDNLLLGLVGVGKEIFGKDFNGLMCYMKNDLSVFEPNSTEDLSKRKFIEYDSIYRSKNPISFYVAREIGANQRFTVKNGEIQSYQEDCELMKRIGKKTSPPARR